MNQTLTATVDAHSPIVADDGVPLKTKLAKTTRRAKLRALFLTVPLLAFLLTSFVWPIGNMLVKSVNNPIGSNVLPQFANAIQGWDESTSEYPPESVFELFVKDMATARTNREPGKTIGNIAVRTNSQYGLTTKCPVPQVCSSQPDEK